LPLYLFNRFARRRFLRFALPLHSTLRFFCFRQALFPAFSKILDKADSAVGLPKLDFDDADGPDTQTK